MASFNKAELESDVRFAWDEAKHQALLYKEAEKKLDYEFLQSQAIDTTLAQLDLNSQALVDQYSTSEDLRARQSQLELGLTTSRNTTELASLGLQGKELALQADLNKLQSTQQIKDYILGVEQNAIAQDQIMQRQDQDISALLGSIATDQMVAKFEQDLRMVTAYVEEGTTKARATVRTGGTSTAKQLAMNTAKALGRSYGEMKIRQQEQNNLVVQNNMAMEGNAMQMFNIALQTTRLRNQGELTAKEADIRQAQLGSQFQGVRNAANQVNAEQTYSENVFRDLTIPGFQLAQKQGQRELKALELGAMNDLITQGMPYRDPIIFEPRRALPGILPYGAGPTLEAKESTGSMIAGAVLAGAQGFMSGGYKKAGGGLGFL